MIFFATISHVEYLSINVRCIEECFDPEVDAPISLPHLKTLELSLDGFPNNDPVIPFLKCLPDLESLHLIIPQYAYGLHKWYQDEGITLSVLTRHLKKVEFLEFGETKRRLDLVRALLEHGNLLEEMVFSCGPKARFHKRSIEIMKQVSKFHKASSTVKLTAVINPSQANPCPVPKTIKSRLYSSRTELVLE